MSNVRTHFVYEPNKVREEKVGKPKPLKLLAEHHTNLCLLQVVLKRGEVKTGEHTMLLAEMTEAERKRDFWGKQCHPQDALQTMIEITQKFRPYM